MRNRVLTFLSVVLLVSCINDKDYDFSEVTLSPEIAFPLAFGDLALANMITRKDSAYIRSYPDGLLYFSYSQTLGATSIHDLFPIPDNTSTTSFNLPAGTLPASSTDTSFGTINGQIDLNLNPQKLTEILLKAGTLNHTLGLSINTSPPNLPLQAVVTMTDVVHKSTLQPLTFSTLNGSGSKQLKDYVIKMINNQFNITVDLIIKPHPTTFIAPGTNANVRLNFAGMDFGYIKGFLGDQTTPIPAQSMEVSVFNSTLKGVSVSLVQPVVKLRVVNDNGVSCELNFTSLQARKTGGTLPFQISPSNPVTLGAPSTMGTSATTDILVNNQDAILNFAPQQLEYGGSVRINKGLISANNFVMDTSKLRISLSAEIPIHGRVSGISMSDTLKIDLTGLNGSNVISSSLRISGRNEMPLDAYVQIYLTDENYQVKDSIFAPNQRYIVTASSVSPSGELLAPGVSEFKVGLDPAKLSKLFDSKYLIIKANMNTARDKNGVLLNVKFKAAYRLKLNVGLLARFNITLK